MTKLINPISSIFRPQKRAEAINLESHHFTEQVKRAERGEVSWSELTLSDRVTLKRAEFVILKMINFIVKIFNAKYKAIDTLFAANADFQTLLKVQHKIKKLHLDGTSSYKPPYVITAEKVDIAATQTRFQSLKAQVSSEHMAKMNEALAHKDTALVTGKYLELPKKLQLILSNIAEMQESGKENGKVVTKKSLQEMLERLHTVYDEHGRNVYTQLEGLLSKKQELLWDHSVLNIVEAKLHKGASLDDVWEDLESLGETHRQFLLHDRDNLTPELLTQRVHTALLAIQEKGIKTIDQTFRDLLEKVHEELSIYEVSAHRLTQDIPPDILTKPITVTMLGVEFSGLVKEGGLGEALEGLAKGMKQQHPENKVRVIFPKFNTLPPKIQEKLKEATPTVFHDKAGHPFNVYKVDLDGIEFHFIDHPTFKLEGTEPSIYDEKQMQRFAAFSGLAADLIKQLPETDVIHLHDWHVAGVALRLKQDDPEGWKNQKIPPVVFTYHNNSRAAQGRFGQGAYNYGPSIQGLVQAGMVPKQTNVFVETVKIADAVTTVSETFGIETQMSEKGEGVSFALREAAEAGKLTGVINGSNPDRWNPEKDRVLKEWKDVESGEPVDLTFGPTSDNILEQKAACRKQLQKWVSLYMPDAEVDLSKPIVTFIGRFDAYQKGLDKLEEAIEATLKSGGQFIVMGAKPKNEDPDAKRILDHLEKKYPQGVLFIRDYKDPNGLFHWQQGDKDRPGIGPLVRAASDYTLVPSRYEPCGLVQFEAWLFGSLAIGAHTGGLADTIIPPDRYGKPFNGYLFDREGNPERSLSAIIPQALKTWTGYSDAEKKEVMKRVMLDARKFSWTSAPSGYSPVEKYRFVYENARRIASKRELKAAAPVKRQFNLNAYMNKIRDPSLLPKGPAASPGDLLEETYQRLYYSSTMGSSKLDELYQALHVGQREQVPSPYGKKIDYQQYQQLGAHQEEGTTRFRVFAPHAKNVKLSILTDQGPVTHRMQKDEEGRWTVSVDVPIGTKYQYLVNGKPKIDPYGLQHEPADKASGAPYSVVAARNGHDWSDGTWMQERAENAGKSAPMSIYELHPTSWKKKDGRFLNYRELADELVKHCQELGYTHIELMGILEHPAEESWGYQVSGFYAPNSRLGSPDDFKYLVDKLHQNKIGVILDWIPAHFATDDYALSSFDSKKMFESSKISVLHALRGLFFNWGTKFFDYKKKHVREFLISSAAYWLKEMHIDALRVDAIRPMLAYDANTSKLFLRDFNAIVHQHFPGVVTIAEDYSGSAETTLSPAHGGLGFDRKWHIGWMKKTLDFFARPPSERSKHYQDLIAAMRDDTFHRQVMALSHDETSLKALIEQTANLGPEEKFANLRALLSFMVCLPGKKLMFMGSEFGTSEVWTRLIGTGEGLMDSQDKPSPKAAQTMAMVKAFNSLYKDNIAFWEHDDNAHDLEWIECNDTNKQVVAYRRSSSEGQSFVCLHNFTDTISTKMIPLSSDLAIDLTLGETFITEALNSDATEFGGEGRVNPQITLIRDENEQPIAYQVIVPPLATVVIKERE